MLDCSADCETKWLMGEGEGQGHVVTMSCFFKITQDSGEVECGCTISRLFFVSETGNLIKIG